MNKEDNISFILSDVESNEARKWMKEHSEVCPCSFKNGNLPAAGEHYYYKIIPTGLGLCITIGCLYCRDAKKDITDFGSW